MYKGFQLSQPDVKINKYTDIFIIRYNSYLYTDIQIERMRDKQKGKSYILVNRLVNITVLKADFDEKINSKMVFRKGYQLDK